MALTSRAKRRAPMLFGVLLLAACCATEYTKLMERKLRQVLGPDFDRYTFASYPTDNFGLGTLYASNADAKDGLSLCAGSTCFGLTPSSWDEWLRLDGFADVGEGPPLALTSAEETELKAELVGPKLAEVLDLGASVDFKTGVTAKLSLGSAWLRRVNLIKFYSFLEGLPPTSPIKKAFDARRLVAVTSDVVIQGLDVELCVDKTLNANLDLTLNQAIGSALGTGGKVRLGVTRTDNGCYALTAQKPVIVAMLARERPPLGTEARLNADTADWPALRGVPLTR